MERQTSQSSQMRGWDGQNGSPYYQHASASQPPQSYQQQYPPFYTHSPPNANYPVPGFGSYFIFGPMVQQTVYVLGDTQSPQPPVVKQSNSSSHPFSPSHLQGSFLSRHSSSRSGKTKHVLSAKITTSDDSGHNYCFTRRRFLSTWLLQSIVGSRTKKEIHEQLLINKVSFVIRVRFTFYFRFFYSIFFFFFK